MKYWENIVKIKELKRNLQDTDYQAIKYAEGELSITDYMVVKEQRRAWRAEINTLEAENETLTKRG